MAMFATRWSFVLASGVLALSACTTILGDDFVVGDDASGGGGAGTGATATTSTMTGGGDPTVGGAGGAVGPGGGGGGPGCGNGTIEAPEECDDGSSNNGPGQSCLANCVLNECGDGDRGPDEGCDAGAANAFALGACAPDCSRVIEVKYIKQSETFTTSGNLGAAPVSEADGDCEAGYKAMVSFGGVRRATTIPFVTANSVDWPVRPYTYYYNANNEPVFLTDDVALIGIRGGAFVGTESNVGLVTVPNITNMTIGALTLQSQNCVGWTSSTSTQVTYGVPFRTDETLIDSDDFGIDCNASFGFYCIEQ